MVIAFHGGMGFGRGIAVGKAWGYAWGHWDWRNHYVNVNIDRHININRNISITRENIQTTRWQHDMSHRKGVSYRNEATRERYGQSARGAETRREFRGFGQETRGLKASGAAPKGLAETKGLRAPVATRQSPDLSKDRSAFGGMTRGSDVRIQSNRGLQSRQSMSSKGTGSVIRGNVGRPR